MTNSSADGAKMAQLDSFHVSPRDSIRSGGCPYMSSNFGVRVGSDDSSLKAGLRGPTLIEDFTFREKISHFDHERIPERVVHARGMSAHGHFQVYDNSLSQFTSARVLVDPSIQTPVFVRFSTILGFRGSADTPRDARGFATRFYTQEGNWDIVGNNIPVFFIQDAIKFPDLVHAAKPEPHREIPQAQTAHDNFWDWVSFTPEATHMVMWIMSDRALPRSARMMQGFGVNTFVLVNEQRQRTFVKFHWRPVLGCHSLEWDESMKIAGTDPDFLRRDLADAIELGAHPEWELGLQLVPESQEHDFDFDLLDCTKLIPEELVPVKYVGKMTLTRNVSEYFTETEQVAFGTQNIVPGIEFSNDPVLHGRNFSYQDTQLTRLGGPNWHELPINRPLHPVLNNQRDGFGKTVIHPGQFNYYPNRAQVDSATPANVGDTVSNDQVDAERTYDGNALYNEKESAARDARAFVHSRVRVEGAKTRERATKFADHYSQATLFWNSMSSVEKGHIIKAFKFELAHVDNLGVRRRIVDRLNHVDHGLAVSVAPAVGIKPPTRAIVENHGRSSPALSQLSMIPDTVVSRKVAVLVADGFEADQYRSFVKALRTRSALPVVVSTRKGTIHSSSVPLEHRVEQESPSRSDLNSERAEAQFTVHTCRSVLFDAVVILGGHGSTAALSEMGETTGFVTEAFKHHKAIFAANDGVQLLRDANLCSLANLQVVSSEENTTVHVDQGVVTVNAWEAGARSEAGADDRGGRSAADAVISAVSSVIQLSRSVSNDSDIAFDKAVTSFLDVLAQHRCWDRQVDRVSN